MNYKGEEISTLYIGGGTPSSLNSKELEVLFDIVKIFKLSNKCEFTFEVNVEHINEDLLIFLHNNKVNRISVGVQTLNSKYIEYLGRKHTETDVYNSISLLKKYFTNINVDLMYGFINQTLEELEEDVKKIIGLDVPHISTYSLIIEPHTKLFINSTDYIDEDMDALMYKRICDMIPYIHYEVSNFALMSFESKHNLTYWNNMEYYGFGLGASGYVNSVRYENTSSLTKYNEGNYIKESHLLSEKEKIENEFILGLRKIEGVSKDDFLKKYNFNIYNIKIVKELIEKGDLIDIDGYIRIHSEKIYISNDILINFLDYEQ